MFCASQIERRPVIGCPQVDTLRQRELEHTEHGDKIDTESRQHVQSLQALSDSLKEALAASETRERAAAMQAEEVAQQQRQQTEEAAQQAAAKAQRLQEQLELLQEQNEPLQALGKSQQAKRKREEYKARRTLKKKENTGKPKSKNSFDVVEKGRYGVTRCHKCTWEISACQC